MDKKPGIILTVLVAVALFCEGCVIPLGARSFRWELDQGSLRPRERILDKKVDLTQAEQIALRIPQNSLAISADEPAISFVVEREMRCPEMYWRETYREQVFDHVAVRRELRSRDMNALQVITMGMLGLFTAHSFVRADDLDEHGELFGYGYAAIYACALIGGTYAFGDVYSVQTGETRKEEVIACEDTFVGGHVIACEPAAHAAFTVSGPSEVLAGWQGGTATVVGMSDENGRIRVALNLDPGWFLSRACAERISYDDVPIMSQIALSVRRSPVWKTIACSCLPERETHLEISPSGGLDACGPPLTVPLVFYCWEIEDMVRACQSYVTEVINANIRPVPIRIVDGRTSEFLPGRLEIKVDSPCANELVSALFGNRLGDSCVDRVSSYFKGHTLIDSATTDTGLVLYVAECTLSYTATCPGYSPREEVLREIPRDGIVIELEKVGDTVEWR